MRAVLALSMLAGCGTATEPASARAIVAKARALASEVCACTDRTCAEPVLARWNALHKDLDGATLDPRDVEALHAEDQRALACIHAVGSVGSASK